MTSSARSNVWEGAIARRRLARPRGSAAAVQGTLEQRAAARGAPGSATSASFLPFPSASKNSGLEWAVVDALFEPEALRIENKITRSFLYDELFPMALHEYRHRQQTWLL